MTCVYIGLLKASETAFLKRPKSLARRCYDEATAHARYRFSMALLPNPLPVHSTPRDRESIIDWARERLKAKDFVVLDTETTGFDSTDEVIQIGIIDSNGTELLDTLIKPEQPRIIPAAAQNVHGITITMLEDAPTLFEISEQMMNTIGSRMVVCYNDQFDMKLIKQTSMKYALPKRGRNLEMQSECAMLAYSQFIGMPGKYAGQYKWQKLPRPVEENHRAIGDCHLTLELIRELAETSKQAEILNFEPEVTQLHLLQNTLKYVR